MKYNVKVAFVFAIVCATCSFCSTSKETRAHESCKDVIKSFVAEYWSYNPETNTYVETKEMVGVNRPGTARSACMRSMSKDDLIEIFGKPSREDSNRMFYFYLKEDFERFDSIMHCTYCMYIQLNDSGKVKYFGFPVMG